MKPLPLRTSLNPIIRPSVFIRKKDALSLSGPDLAGFLRDVLDKGVPFRFRAKGFSMSPFIKDGDVITICPLEGTRPRLGDIVAFKNPKMRRLVVHRLIGKKGPDFRFKGDNISGLEDVVPLNSLFGCVKGVERNGKRVIFGLGPERLIIVLLVRMHIFSVLVSSLRKLLRPVVKRRLS